MEYLGNGSRIIFFSRSFWLSTGHLSSSDLYVYQGSSRRPRQTTSDHRSFPSDVLFLILHSHKCMPPSSRAPLLLLKFPCPLLPHICTFFFFSTSLFFFFLLFFYSPLSVMVIFFLNCPTFFFVFSSFCTSFLYS